ncbi:hypothetical protein TNCV_1792321 [Trichonephila clavipes]|nr:hypothetical protein TNCV_1792321 [Trichonephila clavipes]
MVYEVRRCSSFQSRRPIVSKPMKLGPRRRILGADLLRLPIRDYWGRERGHPRGLKGRFESRTYDSTTPATSLRLWPFDYCGRPRIKKRNFAGEVVRIRRTEPMTYGSEAQ